MQTIKTQASDWAEHRENQGLDSPWTTIKLSGSSVRTQVKKMEKDYDYIVIDTGGRDTSSQRAALTIAHVLVAPFQPKKPGHLDYRKNLHPCGVKFVISIQT